MKKRPTLTLATRMAFVEALCRLGKRKPIEKITIKELTDKAGYSRATFYQHFEDIYVLLDFVESIVIKRVKANFLNIIERDNFNETFIDVFIKTQSEHARYFDLLLSPSVGIRFARRLIKEVAPVFIDKFKLPSSEPTTDYIIELYFNTVLRAIGLWIERERDLPLEVLSRLIGRALSKGLISAVG